jgi:hypothetical protein
MTFRGRPSPWWRRNLTSRGRFACELAAIEGALEAGEPRLASMFAVFTTLTNGEPASRAEPLSRPGWRPPWLARAVTLLAIAAVLAGAVVLGAMLPQMVRPCVPVTTAAASAAGSPVHHSSGTTARGPVCAAYPTRR